MPTKHLLDLAREHVDAADDQHVVAAAGDALHTAERPPARARLGDDPRDVPRAVADDRDALLRERREHDLADLAVGHGLKRLGIDDLDEEVVLEHVQPVLVLALGRHSGSHDLGQTVDVDRA